MVTEDPALVEDGFPRSWQPVDLGPVLDGTWQPARPAVGARTDGVGLFYPGKVHTVASESEAGKTWFALAAVAVELAAGRTVVYLDFEDDEGGIVGRLRALQVPTAAILERFVYIRPTQPLGTGLHRDDLAAALARRPSLAVVDGVTEAMVMHGLDPLSNKDAATFGRILPRPLAAAGCAVACLDHVTKDREGRGRYAIGAVHKLNALDGAAYVLECRTPLGVGLTGRSTVRLAKDRPGQLRTHGKASTGGLHWFGDLVLTSHAETWVEVEITPPTDKPASFRPTVLMSRISEALTEHGELSQRRIRAAVTGKNDAITQALDCLILDGHVSESSPHKLLHPYPPEEGA